jgi:hypothetical protein
MGLLGVVIAAWTVSEVAATVTAVAGAITATMVTTKAIVDWRRESQKEDDECPS